jgi:Bacterial SH3 domain
LIHRDTITEALADALQPRSPGDMAPITQASFQAFYALIGEQLEAGPGVVCETNFQQGVAEGELRPLIENARAVVIHCQVDRALGISRFIQRAERGERHWCYFDHERIADIEAGSGLEAWDRAEPLELGVPVLIVDTTAGYDPNLDAIVRFAASATPVGAHSRGRAAPDPQPLTSALCPALGFVDNRDAHYSHPTNLHRCFAGPAPDRVSIRQQREQCLTQTFASCPRFVAQPPTADGPARVPPAQQEAPARPRRVPEPRPRAHPEAVPSTAAEASFEAALATATLTARNQAQAPAASQAQAPTAKQIQTSAANQALTAVPAERHSRAGRMLRGVAMGVGFAAGVAVAAAAVLLLLAGDGPPDLELDEVSRLAVESTATARINANLAAAGRALPTPASIISDASSTTAGIQQAAAVAVEAPATPPPTLELTALPAPSPAATPSVRRATIRAPAGFDAAILREGPATTARSLRQLANGTSVDLLDGLAAGDGFTWARARTQDGAEGWVVSTALQ